MEWLQSPWDWLLHNAGGIQVLLLLYIAARIEQLPTAKHVARFADLIIEHMTRINLADERRR